MNLVETADRILRVHTIARLMGRSRRTIRRRIQNRVYPAIRIGRRAWASGVTSKPANGGHFKTGQRKVAWD